MWVNALLWTISLSDFVTVAAAAICNHEKNVKTRIQDRDLDVLHV